jgi:hypothetical protein
MSSAPSLKPQTRHAAMAAIEARDARAHHARPQGRALHAAGGGIQSQGMIQPPPRYPPHNYSSQSTDLRMYQPLSSRVGMYSVVQSSPVAPTALFDCAT